MKYGFCRRVCINLDLIGRRFAKQIHRDEAKRNRDEFFGVDWKKSNLYEVLKVQTLIILDSSMVEHSAVNRVVVGSSPTRGVFFFLGSMVKRLRHRPFTAVTRVRFPLESFQVDLIWYRLRHYADVAQLAEQLICNQQVIGSSPIIGLYIWTISSVG